MYFCLLLLALPPPKKKKKPVSSHCMRIYRNAALIYSFFLYAASSSGLQTLKRLEASPLGRLVVDMCCYWQIHCGWRRHAENEGMRQSRGTIRVCLCRFVSGRRLSQWRRITTRLSLLLLLSLHFLPPTSYCVTRPHKITLFHSLQIKWTWFCRRWDVFFSPLSL